MPTCPVCGLEDCGTQHLVFAPLDLTKPSPRALISPEALAEKRLRRMVREVRLRAWREAHPR